MFFFSRYSPFFGVLTCPDDPESNTREKVSVRGELYESEYRPTSSGKYHDWMEDVERLDEMIGRYLPLALSEDQDFDRALRATYVVLELIETQTPLLESYVGSQE